MKLQRLELFGFKSFADRVTIEFNPGITAIVGPNGCGKSNISDAIRWVLGEQRPTLVRGTKMDEVIFSGSSNRKQINLAEVELHFANTDGLIPIEYSEVAIARRVFREGESEYRLNKNLCRLRDIQDLFFGTGIGTHAYSLIQQGMVDSILSERAEERRYIFEEAAGVTRYKQRRHASQRKLEATSLDLQRVEDIVAEVEKKVRSLKRQVGKSRRFRSYEAEETRLEVHSISLEMEDLRQREAPTTKKLDDLTTQEAELAARLGELEASLETLEIDLISKREGEQQRRAEREDVGQRITRREESRLVTGETLKHNQQRLDVLSTEDSRAFESSEQLTTRRTTLEQSRHEAASRVAEIASQLESVGQIEEEEDRYAELKVERTSLIAQVENLQDELAEVRQAAARQATTADSTDDRVASLQAILEDGRKEHAEVEEAVSLDQEALTASEARWVELAEEVVASQNVVRDAARRLEESREELAITIAAEKAAVSRHETLSAMEARFEGYAQGARELLSGRGKRNGLAGALPQVVEPRESRFEQAIESYLESLGDGLLARDQDAALSNAKRLTSSKNGRADFLIPQFLANGVPPEVPGRAAKVVIAKGTDAVRWKGERRIGDQLEPLFSRLLIVADRADAFKCRESISGSPEAARHYVIVGLDGTLLEPTGRWRMAGATEDDGRLARRRRLAEAKEQLIVCHETTKKRQQEVRSRELALGEAEQRLEEVDVRAREADAAHRSARERIVVSEEACGQAARRVNEIAAQLAEQLATRERALSSREELGAKETVLEADLETARERLSQVSSTLDRYEEERAERLSARHAVELKHAEAEADLRAVEMEMEHLQAAERALTEARDEREAERTRLVETNSRLETEQKASVGEIEELYTERDGIDLLLRESVEGLQGLEERRSGFESELRDLRRRHDEITERRHRCALEKKDLDYRRETLVAQLEEGHDVALAELVERHPLEEEEQELPLIELKGRLHEVRRKKANLGPVNMLAVEEYEEESERLEFLTTQRDDLVAAKHKLEEAIRRINSTAKTLFEETFERARDSFDTTFRKLFEGGHAEIRLADPDEPLESPIEIVASPRGKRVRSINLLSGGERALTALALLFAIYQIKPSPFCILDEVDAALDDANVSRFLTMIRHFSSQTQFVIITHNKRTMEEADYLYGVTMEEPGVSSVVSVALDGPGDGRNGKPDGEQQGAEQEALAAAG